MSCEKRQSIQDSAKKGSVGTGDIDAEKADNSGSAAFSKRCSSLVVSHFDRDLENPLE